MKENLTKDILTEMYRRMNRIRRFEDRAVELHANGEIPGSLHTSHGQEGEIVGACTALRLDDFMVGNHRSHGHPIGKGAQLRGLMAELLAKETGVCKGKGGSMHLADFSVGSLGETSIVGSGIPIAAGAALGAKLQGSDRVSLCFFGDGASNEGAFHEGLNFAAIWKLPAIFLCENNGYAVSTPIKETAMVSNIADRAIGYGMPGIVVDGQDIIAVHEVMLEAVRRARSGDGPTLIEAKTYRYLDHAANLHVDLGQYRPQSEIDDYINNRDPISLFRQRLLADFGFSEDVLKDVDAEVAADVEDSITFARASSYPAADQAFEHLYA